MKEPDAGKVDESIPDQNDESLNDGQESQGNAGLSQDERLAHFISLLSDDNEISRWKAAEALGRMGDPRAVDDLVSVLWDEDTRVRLKAAWALGRIGDQRAYAPLRRLYRMEDETAQEIIQEALENIREGMSRQ